MSILSIVKFLLLITDVKIFISSMKQNTPRETTLPIKLPKKSVENIDFKMSLSQIKVKFSLIWENKV